MNALESATIGELANELARRFDILIITGFVFQKSNQEGSAQFLKLRGPVCLAIGLLEVAKLELNGHALHALAVAAESAKQAEEEGDDANPEG